MGYLTYFPNEDEDKNHELDTNSNLQKLPESDFFSHQLATFCIGALGMLQLILNDETHDHKLVYLLLTKEYQY